MTDEKKEKILKKCHEAYKRKKASSALAKVKKQDQSSSSHSTQSG
jgi:hypothetical protein